MFGRAVYEEILIASGKADFGIHNWLVQLVPTRLLIGFPPGGFKVVAATEIVEFIERVP